MRKDIKKSSYYVWFLGAQESKGLRGAEYVVPVVKNLVQRERDVEPFKVTLQVSHKGLKIIQNIPPATAIGAAGGKSVKNAKPEVVKHFIPHHAVTCVLQDDDIVACILLLYNPVTKCPVHVHAYRCDSVETAEILRGQLQTLIERPENQKKLNEIEARLRAKGLLATPARDRDSGVSERGRALPVVGGANPVPRRLTGGGSDGRSTSTRESESSGGSSSERLSAVGQQERIANLYDSLAAELREKLGAGGGGGGGGRDKARAPHAPILLPPRDYDTVHRQKGNLTAIDLRRCLNANIVGVNVKGSAAAPGAGGSAARGSSGGSSGIGSDHAPSPDAQDVDADGPFLDHQSSSDEDWAEQPSEDSLFLVQPTGRPLSSSGGGRRAPAAALALALAALRPALPPGPLQGRQGEVPAAGEGAAGGAAAPGAGAGPSPSAARPATLPAAGRPADRPNHQPQPRGAAHLPSGAAALGPKVPRRLLVSLPRLGGRRGRTLPLLPSAQRTRLAAPRGRTSGRRSLRRRRRLRLPPALAQRVQPGPARLPRRAPHRLGGPHRGAARRAPTACRPRHVSTRARLRACRSALGAAPGAALPAPPLRGVQPRAGGVAAAHARAGAESVAGAAAGAARGLARGDALRAGVPRGHPAGAVPQPRSRGRRRGRQRGAAARAAPPRGRPRQGAQPRAPLRQAPHALRRAGGGAAPHEPRPGARVQAALLPGRRQRQRARQLPRLPGAAGAGALPGTGPRVGAPRPAPRAVARARQRALRRLPPQLRRGRHPPRAAAPHGLFRVVGARGHRRRAPLLSPRRAVPRLSCVGVSAAIAAY